MILFFSCVILQATDDEDVTKVQPIHINTIADDKDIKHSKVAAMNRAKFLNTIASVAFIILLAIFNVGFWTVAFLEHSKSPEYYTTGH